MFADWGAADWSENLVAAEQYARETLATVAREKAWPSTWSAVVEGYIAKEVAASKGYFSDDVAGFWVRLGADMAATSGTWPANWSKLANAYSSGSIAAETVAKGRDEGTVAAVVGGAVEASAEDIATGIDPRKSAIPWLVALGLLGVGLIMRGRK